MNKNVYFHSVTLDEDKCLGCTNCIKRCPTEAIRVRNGKARIINERCIDCGECIRICPHHAKKAITDDFDQLDKYRYSIALPAPSFYAQFEKKYSRNRILTALEKTGFDGVFEVARGAEVVTQTTKRMIKEGKLKTPIISSACPAVVRLIQVKYPNLIDHLLKLESPMEVAAMMARKQFSKQFDVEPEKIGIFFISPCPAKATSVKAPYEIEKSNVDGVIAIKDAYLKVLDIIDKVEEESLEEAGYEGVRWANSGGESLALGKEEFLAVDGIHNVLKILDEIEDDRLDDVVFVEALSCLGGCLGGPLVVKNPYVAKTILNHHINEAKERIPKKKGEEEIGDLVWTNTVEYKPVLKLDQDFMKAMQKMEDLEQILDDLPGLDCGACGAPSCRALAEDIVRGNAKETDCIFKLKDKVKELASQMAELEKNMSKKVNDDEDKDK